MNTIYSRVKSSQKLALYRIIYTKSSMCAYAHFHSIIEIDSCIERLTHFLDKITEYSSSWPSEHLSS